SRVRQVIAFGEAPGMTPFSSLLESARHGQPNEHGALVGSGPVDEPGPPEGNGLAEHARPGLCRGSAGELTHRDVVVAAPPCGDGQAYTSLLDVTLLTGATLVAAPLPLVAAAMRVYKGTAAIIPPGTGVPGLEPTRIFPAA
ncbi:MAG: hypothetical protein ACRDOD_05125, partial [Streptosporangiaceae bacterium]